jgi:UDP-4-amino-4,6-dideoxy-N-acetyl-beta-L-altrosamine transaminase
VSDYFIPYGRQWVDDEDIRAITEVLKSDYLTTGPEVERFESQLAAVTGARFAVAVNSGTSALHAMYFAAGLDRGDEIITSPLTFAATANAALYLGASVRFADVLPDSGNIDPSSVKRLLTPRTKLIVPVDFTGNPADYDELAEVAAAADVRVVADAAHSLGAVYHGRRVGTLATATELSFHPVKPVTTAEGGAVLTDDEEIASRAARFRTHGITRDELTAQSEGAWFYEQVDLGFNYRLTDVQAALGTSQLRNLDRFITRRRDIAERYSTALSDIEALQLPVTGREIDSGWHLYVVRVRDASRRRRFFDQLRHFGLGVQVHYIPVYWHPFYREIGYEVGLCPNAEDWYRTSVSLPIFPKMTDCDIDSAIDRIREAARKTL